MVTVCFGEFHGMTYVGVVRKQQSSRSLSPWLQFDLGEFDGMTYVRVLRDLQIVGHCNHGDSLLW